MSLQLLLFVLLSLTACSKNAEVEAPKPVAKQSTAKLYFQLEGSLFAAGLDGSNPQKVFTGSNPDPFTDATKVAYTFYTPAGGRQIAVYDRVTKTNNLFKAIPGDNNYGPVISPDSKWLAFNYFQDKDWSIAIVDTAGKEIDILTDAGGNYSPAWNSKGDVIYYHTMDTLFSVSVKDKSKSIVLPLGQLFAMKASASSAMRIATAANDRYLIFDADGESRSVQFDYPWATIYKFDTETKTLERISPDSVFAAAPCISSDGSTIYFEGFEKKDIPAEYEEEPLIWHYIYSMNLDGSGLKRLCKGEHPTVR